MLGDRNEITEILKVHERVGAVTRLYHRTG
jgi:hypothetical protein